MVKTVVSDHVAGQAAGPPKSVGERFFAGQAAADYCEEDPAKFDKAIMFECWSTMRETMFLDMAFSAMGRTQDWNMAWLHEFAVENGRRGRKSR